MEKLLRKITYFLITLREKVPGGRMRGFLSVYPPHPTLSLEGEGYSE